MNIGIEFEDDGFQTVHCTGVIDGATPAQALEAVRNENSRTPFRMFADFVGADPRFREPVMSGEDGAFRAVGGEMQSCVPSYEEQRADQLARGVAMRFNAGKLRYDLIPADALEVLAAIYTMGAAKYADRNWEKGFDWMSCYASLQRHAQLWNKGEDRDAESGELHMGHVAWNAMALVAFALRGVGNDDRVKLV